EEDAGFLALVKDINELGVKEPLVITLDHYILSGHRRFAACKRLDLKQVPCRYELVRRGAPNFLRLLVAYNQQRVKSTDEAIREAVVATSKEDAHRDLIEHRQRVARVVVALEPIVMEGKQRRSKISTAKGPMLEAVLQVLRDRADFLPL